MLTHFKYTIVRGWWETEDRDDSLLCAEEEVGFQFCLERREWIKNTLTGSLSQADDSDGLRGVCWACWCWETCGGAAASVLGTGYCTGLDSPEIIHCPKTVHCQWLTFTGLEIPETFQDHGIAEFRGPLWVSLVLKSEWFTTNERARQRRHWSSVNGLGGVF